MKVIQTELNEEEYELLKERRTKDDNPFFYRDAKKCESDESKVSKMHDKNISK
jgi:hypothetical protein